MSWIDAGQIILNSIFSGLGTAIGAYFANKHLTKRLETILNQFKGLTKPKKK